MTNWFNDIIETKLPAAFSNMLHEQLKDTLPEGTTITTELLGTTEACVTFTYGNTWLACTINLDTKQSDFIRMCDHTMVTTEGFETIPAHTLLGQAGNLLHILNLQTCRIALATYETMA